MPQTYTLDDFESAKAALDRIKTHARDLITPVFTAALQEGFRVLRWNQYTPGFNDGDPCYFTVGDKYLLPIGRVFLNTETGQYRHITDPDVLALDGEGWEEVNMLEEDPEDSQFDGDGNSVPGAWSNAYVYTYDGAPEYTEGFKRAVELIGKLDSDLLEAAFGDNREITVTLGEDGKAAFQVDEYECGY